MSKTAEHLLALRKIRLPRIELVGNNHGTYAIALVLDGNYQLPDAERVADFLAKQLAAAVHADTGERIDFGTATAGPDQRREETS